MFVDASQRTFAVGIWVTGFSVGALVGPPLGGVLLAFFWWGSVFLVAVPAMALLVASGRLLLPEYRDPDPRPFDPVGTALSLLAVLAAIYGLKRAVHDGLAWPSAASILLGLGVGVAFVRRDRRRADPLIDARLLRMPAFGVSLGAYFLVTFVAVGALLFVFQYLQLVLGLSALTAALWAIPAFLAFVAGSLLTPPLVRRVRPAYTMTFGLLLAAAGYALLTRVDAGSGARPFIVATVVANLGEAPVFTLANDLIIGAVPTERAGAAAALSETGSELGGALGVAILGSLAAALYRGGVADAVPAGLSPDRAAAARDTLGGAVSVADTLPVPVARELLQTSRDAFVHGLHVAALSSALLAAGLAVLIGVLLRGVGRPGALSDE
jgi:DHA2 family multidrug resistance protein-like MFS transporter